MAALFRVSRNLLQMCNKHADIAMASSRAMASKTAVGFIGLGNMGSPMAKNLLKHGYPIVAADTSPECGKELQDLGAQIVDCPAEVADKTDRIITMLPSSPNVVDAYTGPHGILKKVKKGTLLIDSSTIDPSVSKEMAAAAEKMGAVFMDAPVSGGVGAASLAKLTFMVGGPEEEFTAVKELLGCMGANVLYCGPVGTGQAAKICNNMLLAIGMIGTAETMNLGIRYGRPPPEKHLLGVSDSPGRRSALPGRAPCDGAVLSRQTSLIYWSSSSGEKIGSGQHKSLRLGLDPKLLAQILNMSSGRCWSSDAYNPVPGVMEGVPSANNYQGGYSTTLMTKDLGLAQDTATDTKTPIPLGSLAHEMYRVMCTRGYASKDFSSVFQFLREKEGQ